MLATRHAKKLLPIRYLLSVCRGVQQRTFCAADTPDKKQQIKQEFAELFPTIFKSAVTGGALFASAGAAASLLAAPIIGNAGLVHHAPSFGLTLAAVSVTVLAPIGFMRGGLNGFEQYLVQQVQLTEQYLMDHVQSAVDQVQSTEQYLMDHVQSAVDQVESVAKEVGETVQSTAETIESTAMKPIFTVDLCKNPGEQGPEQLLTLSLTLKPELLDLDSITTATCAAACEVTDSITATASTAEELIKGALDPVLGVITSRVDRQRKKIYFVGLLLALAGVSACVTLDQFIGPALEALDMGNQMSNKLGQATDAAKQFQDQLEACENLEDLGALENVAEGHMDAVLGEGAADNAKEQANKMMGNVLGEGVADDAKEQANKMMGNVLGEGAADNAKEQAKKWIKW